MDDEYPDRSGCRDCREDLEHCHGTVIRHLLHGPECTEDGCTGSALIPHAFTVDCAATGCRCAMSLAG